MKSMLCIALIAAGVGVASSSHAANAGDALAKNLEKALAAGDFAAAGALADIDGAPADARFAYFDTVHSCAADMRCKVHAAPLDADFKKQLAEDAKAADAEPIAAEGMIVVEQSSTDGSGSGNLTMPFVKSGGGYKIAVMKPGAAAIAKARAQTNEALMTKFLAGGILDPATGRRRTDWATAATKLPADGGDAGRAFVAQTRAMSAAVDAKDPDAAMRSGGRWAEIVFSDKSYDGKPIGKALRQRKLHAQSQRMLRDVRIGGGYQLGDDAVLMFDASNGSGWIERGVVLVSREGNAWTMSGKETVSYPK